MTKDSIRQMLYIVRGVSVMLDADLAALYGYTTKAFNQQVKNNIAKFDADFRFQLTKEEYDEILKSKKMTLGLDSTNSLSDNNEEIHLLRSKKLTSKTESRGGRQYIPYAFTEQGIYMLMTVLKGDLAIKQSKALIRTFKEMKDFLVDKRSLIGPNDLVRLSLQTAQNTTDIAEIKSEMHTKSNLAEVIRDFTGMHARSEYLISQQNVGSVEKYVIFAID